MISLDWPQGSPVVRWTHDGQSVERAYDRPPQSVMVWGDRVLVVEALDCTPNAVTDNAVVFAADRGRSRPPEGAPGAGGRAVVGVGLLPGVPGRGRTAHRRRIHPGRRLLGQAGCGRRHPRRRAAMALSFARPRAECVSPCDVGYAPPLRLARPWPRMADCRGCSVECRCCAPPAGRTGSESHSTRRP